MRLLSLILACGLVASMVAGCAKPPERHSQLSRSTAEVSSRPHGFKGRTLQVGSIDDLVLRPGEVILTFDDGPSPTVTPIILATLAEHKVKATFFMVGSMAQAHAETARMVAAAGHTIGSHTHGHENLRRFTSGAAMHAIATGETEVAAALAPSGARPAPFFRFPYLSHTQVLRADVTDLGYVIFDVQVDSRDFEKESPNAVLARTLSRLDAAGGGIVLFHDIHMRTAKMLPQFLTALKARGYSVVHAVPKPAWSRRPIAVASR